MPLPVNRLSVSVFKVHIREITQLCALMPDINILNILIVFTVVGTFLMIQGLRLQVSNAGGVGSIPGQGTKIPYAT